MGNDEPPEEIRTPPHPPRIKGRETALGCYRPRVLAARPEETRRRRLPAHSPAGR